MNLKNQIDHSDIVKACQGNRFRFSDTLFPCELWVLYQKGMISHEYKNKKTNPLS